jgi:tRNA(His) 5'-end guanylyltransferase
MTFDELDKSMRIFETALDYPVLPGIYIVARVDGRSFTRLTKEVHHFEFPYDERFRDYMVETASHLMQCGFHVLYGHTQSDEISLLFHRDEMMFGRKMRKYISILSGEASAKFSLLLGDIASFDCRISQLPAPEYVVDYFRWRSEDARRNALNGHCYYLLRSLGKSVDEATDLLRKLSVAGKREVLHKAGKSFKELPGWQKHGVGLFWETYTTSAVNPVTGETVHSERRRIKVEYILPVKNEYERFVLKLIEV